jgi:alkylation response protein AidB-like acyl-CoA dehydrogenase
MPAAARACPTGVSSGSSERSRRSSRRHRASSISPCSTRRARVGKPIGGFRRSSGGRGAVELAAGARWPRARRDAACWRSTRARRAKARTSEAAVAAAAIAHAVHGAIGVTEGDLQLYTRRLWAWRLDFGSEAYWAGVIGRRVLGDDRSAWQHIIEASTLRA